MTYDGKEYYFVIDGRDEETKEITKWHWAFDGGLGYVFKDYKFYVMTFISLVLSMFVASVNFTSTIRSLTKTIICKNLIYRTKRQVTIRNTYLCFASKKKKKHIKGL